MNRAADNESQLSPIKRALLEIRELRAKIEESEYSIKEPIAIIGMGLRFPGGAKDPESFWRLLRDGVDAITEVPSDRWDVDAYYDPNPDAPGKMSTRWGGFLEDIDKFDPEFFGISPREAISLDPQQRLLLEVVWESLENAGQAPGELFGSLTGVFIGIATFDYFQDQLQRIDPKQIDAYFATGSIHSVASGRLSYVLGLRGPSISLDTACSSSLVAIHQACHSLRSRECHMALAGGVNLILRPELHINFSKTHVMASDGRCKAFDARADGFVRSEGCGMVVLKRLSDALGDNDRILALIRSSAVNQDGRSSGLTAPNGPSQQDVIRVALANAGIAPTQVQYVEAHGTGTALGDPIEVHALAEVLGKDRTKSDPVLIGSVKTNVGHLETAAGVAGLIKVVLALQHEQIPPHLHLERLNPHIPWDQIPVIVTKEGMAWPKGECKRIAGISSFGFSGTNAHVVVEEAPPHKEFGVQDKRPLHLLTLSAQSELALRRQAQRMGEHLLSESDLALGDVAYTANRGRSHFARRLALIAETTEQAREKLDAFAEGTQLPGVVSGEMSNPDQPDVVFMFTGEEAQPLGMGRRLYETQPVFREALNRCAECLRPYLDRPLLTVLYPEDADSGLLNETMYTQPALFALEYALASLWRSWGIVPAAVIGHSVGEYVAACMAGIFSLEDGLKLIAERGRLMQGRQTGGMMVAVFADEEQVRLAAAPYASDVSIAAINGPTNIVVSGREQAIRAVLAQLDSQGISSRQLVVSHAFHSPLMDPMLEDFEAYTRKVDYKVPTIPLVSNLTGTFFNHDRNGNARYWRRHARETVRFAAGMRTLFEGGYRLFLEIGPNPTLCGLGRQCTSDDTAIWLPSLRRGRSDWQQMMESLAELYIRGLKVDWGGFDQGYGRHKVTLPTYPFQRERYWPALSENGPHRRPTADASHVWERVVAAGSLQSLQIPIDLALHTYGTKWRCLQHLTTSYILRALRQLSIYTHTGETHTVEDLIAQLGIADTYRGLIRRWLSRLVDEGLLLQHGNQYLGATPLPLPELDSALVEAREALREIPFLLEYIERCGDMLPALLTGKQSPLEALFPGGSSDTAIDIYQHWALSRYFNGIAAAVVDALAKSFQHDRPMRILEVGAGVGGLTSAILQVIPMNQTEYWYTDISEFFFADAGERYKECPFLRFGRLDIESSPLEQGYGSHGFDIVIAGNTLHGTRHIDKALEHARSLLRPGGVLLLCETTRHLLWYDMTFGLLEMDRDPNDPLRHDAAWLEVSQWEHALLAKGFGRTAHFPQSGSPAEDLGQHILIAQLPENLDVGKGVLLPEARQAVDTRAHAVDEAIPEEPPAKAEGEDILSTFWNAPKIDRHEILAEFTRAKVRKVLRRDKSKPVGRGKRLMDFGVDSLMAVELRTLLRTGLSLESDLPATLIFDYPTVDDIAAFLLEKLQPVDHSPSPAAEEKSSKGDQPPIPAETDIDDLDEDAMEDLLKARLDMLEEED